MQHHGSLFRCYFGNNRDNLNPEEYLALAASDDILVKHPFSQLKKNMHLQKLFFLRQIHSTEGFVITQDNNEVEQSFVQSGDYLITNQKNIGIGVMTADCLPIIMIDTLQGAIGVAHAGWRGTVLGIAVQMLHALQKNFNTNPQYVKVFFGPSAKACCYEVSDSFSTNLEHLSFKDELIIAHNNKQYFDLVLCNRLLLQEAGINKEAIGTTYSLCTVCDHSFYSHRRGDKGRQMTVVSLV